MHVFTRFCPFSPYWITDNYNTQRLCVKGKGVTLPHLFAIVTSIIVSPEHSFVSYEIASSPSTRPPRKLADGAFGIPRKDGLVLQKDGEDSVKRVFLMDS